MFTLINILYYFLGFADVLTKVYICDFHRLQAWERWARKCKDLSPTQRDDLILALRLDAVKQTEAYKYPSVEKYLSRHWFKCMERWVKALRDKRFEIGKIIFNEVSGQK